jgi:hypothetical protein
MSTLTPHPSPGESGEKRELYFQASARINRFAQASALVGAMGFGLGAFFVPDTAWTHLLLLGFLGVGFALAGALFIALQYVTGAGWSVALRRVSEAMVALLPVAGLLVLIALVAYPSLYPWTDPKLHLHGDFKRLWLQRPFFLIRAMIYLIIWIGSAYALVRTSRQQDVDASMSHTFANRRWSGLFLVLFGIAFWLASYDWLMSREPEWVSTIYGVYNFAGLFTSGLAVFILLVLWLQKLGPFRAILSQKHLHDLGKLLFGMCVFWAYLWYCQYMLIWFVNNPEETPYYIRRLQGFWTSLFYINVALNAIIPFFVLLPKATKLSAKVLVNICIVVLLGRWLDLYLMILPDDHGLLSVVVILTMTYGALGLYVVVFCRALASAPLIARNDPYLVESMPAEPGLRHGDHG